MPLRSRLRALAVVLCLGLAATACAPGSSPQPGGSPTTPRPTGTRTTTAPPARTFGFAVLGDFGSGNGNERAVADELRAWAEDHPLDAVVTTGDNVYETGDPDEFDAAWHEPYGWVDKRGVPVLAALGNHDVDAQGNTKELGLFDIPGPWYARTIGPVRFLVLDANRPTDPEQLAWLRAALAKDTGARWTVVAFHQAAYSCGFHPSTQAVDEAWVPLFGPAGVDLVLNGHDHNYQRFPRTDGVTYVLQGSGGADLYPVLPILCPTGTPKPVFSDHDHHLFLYLSARANRLSGRAVTAGGEVVDSFVLPGR